MKKLTLMMVMLLASVVAFAQSANNLIPTPQLVKYAGGTFVMGKVVLDTPVWQEEWENWITEAGGEAVTKSSRKIAVKLVPEITGAKLNQEEAYRLKVTRQGVEVEAVTEKACIGLFKLCAN